MSSGMKEIGSTITRIRQEKDMTQKQLGALIGTTQSAIARMEKGEQNLSTEMLSKISKALNRDIVSLSKGHMNIEIEGGRKLSGSITTNTSKNAAVALLCASLLNKNVTVFKNMPRIEEVYRIIEVLESIGVFVRWMGDDVEITPPRKLKLNQLNENAARKTRSVIMLVGSLVHLTKTFSLPHIGGCKLGLRSLKPHFIALGELGISVKKNEDYYTVSAKQLKPGSIVLSESGDTVTENALLTAARIPGKTVIKYASANYQVQDLCLFLQALGVAVSGIGTTTLTVEGKEEIDEPITFYPSEDPIESMFFLAAAAVTKSSLTITRCPIEFLELELLTLKHMGFRYKILKRYTARNGFTKLVDIRTYPSHLIAPTEKIHARPYPGLNIDNLPFFAVIATQAKGQTLIHDWVYEKRAIQYTELDKLGAETLLADPHRIFITGPTELKPAELICPPALRSAAILLIGMLAAKGHSVLRNVYSISRGYEDLVSRLNTLGAKVRLLPEL